MHHFIFGVALMPLTWIAGGTEHDEISDVLAGVVTALVLSEIKRTDPAKLESVTKRCQKIQRNPLGSLLGAKLSSVRTEQTGE